MFGWDGVVKDALIDLGLHNFGDPVGGGGFGSALTVVGTATDIAKASAAVQDFLNKISPSNRDIMDGEIRGICGNGPCSDSQINELVDELSNLSFMGVRSWRDIFKVAPGKDNSAYIDFVRQVIIARVKQLGY